MTIATSSTLFLLPLGLLEALDPFIAPPSLGHGHARQSP